MYIFYMKLLTSCSQSLVLVFLVCLSFSCVTHAQSDEILDAMIFDGVLLNKTTTGRLQEQVVKGMQLQSLFGEEADNKFLVMPMSFPQPELPDISGQEISAYQFEINELERREGHFSPQLIQNLLMLAGLYQRQGNHLEAIALYQRADHISRINYGLYDRGQLPIIEGLIKSYLAREDFESVNEQQRYLLFLSQKLHDQGSMEQVRSLAEIADYNMETFSQSLLVTTDPSAISMFRLGGMDAPGAPEYARQFALESLYRARRHYADAISTLIENERFQHPRLLELEYKYLETIFLAGFRGELIFNPHYYLTSARVSANLPNRWTCLRRNNEGYELGIKTFERILAYLELDESTTDVERVRARIELADCHLVFGWQDAAREEYAQAFARARELALSPESMTLLFSPEIPVQLPLFTARPNSREKFSISAETPLNYSGYLDVSYSINSNGTAGGIKVLDKSDRDAYKVADRLRRYLRNAPFRPYIIDGNLVERDQIEMRYYYTFQ